MELFFGENVNKTPVLDPKESHHAIRVLRKRIGDELEVTDGLGGLYKCRIISDNPRSCELEILEKNEVPPAQPQLHIAISPTKSLDRVLWFVEKSTEIGINGISLLQTRNTERTKINLSKVRSRAISAIKQSQQCWLPSINERGFDQISDFQQEQKFIAHLETGRSKDLNQVIQDGKSAVILIGPEGDFTPEEIDLALDHNFHMVSLGATRLRTETAGIVATTLLRSSL